MENLTNLTELYLLDNELSSRKVEKLRQILPDCKIRTE